MFNRLLPSLCAVASVASFSCSDDAPSDVTIIADAAVPDAAPAPDAFVCTQTECGDECVDTSSNPFHCGGCGMACDTPGQLCTGTLPCACPEDFVTSPVGGGGFSQVMMQGNAYFGLAAVTVSPFNLFTIFYDLSVETETDYNLADNVGTFNFPTAGLGYDVDTGAFTARTTYVATAGTVNFSMLCATGIAGTMTDVQFTEAMGLQNPTPVDGGCQLSYDTLEFSIGTCDAMSDAGPMDGGSAVDAGVDGGS